MHIVDDTVNQPIDSEKLLQNTHSRRSPKAQLMCQEG